MLNYKYNLKELIDILTAQNALDDFIADIFRFNLICDETIGIEELLFDAHITTSSKTKYLEHILKGHIGDAFYSFIYQLVLNNDIDYYEYIRKKFITLLSHEKNCTFIEVISAIPLTKLQLDKIKTLLESQGHTVYIYNSTSKKIVGGFIINYGDRIIDLSVQGGIEQIRTKILQSV